MRNVFAVFDTEQAYAFRMMEYLNCRKNMPFEVQMFTSAEALISFTGKRHVDLLLVSARAAEDRILQLSVGKIVVLAEGEIDKRLASYPSVCKYQSARQIVREVMDFYSAEKDAAAPVRMMKPNVRRIGVVSTWEPGLRTALAIALGGILAESRSVLYASLDPWSGAADALSGDADRTMSELLYYYRQGKNGLIYLSDTMVRSIRGMHYIPPAAHPGDLMMMQTEQWEGFFSELLETGAYDTLILDMGSDMIQPEGVLSSCTEIYMPVTGNIFSERAAAALQTWAEDNHAEWKDRLRTVVIDGDTEEECRQLLAANRPVSPMSEDDGEEADGEADKRAGRKTGRGRDSGAANRRNNRGTDNGEPDDGEKDNWKKDTWNKDENSRDRQKMLYGRERIAALRSGRMGKIACRLEHERISGSAADPEAVI